MGVLVVAYNAETTLVNTLNRLPESFRRSVDHILVADDASIDATYEIGLEYQNGSELPLTMIKHRRNKGYGGNQKYGYRWAIDHGLDVVVLLHGDGQYAPEIIEDLLNPILRGEADAVFGSRMMERGSARAGGMPLYKYLGNRILTTFQNTMTGSQLSEWHSGYRAYRVEALRTLPFADYTNDFDFDTEIILGLIGQGRTIKEVPIPTYYGDEICYVNGMRYAGHVAGDVFRFRAQRVGLGSSDTGLEIGACATPYAVKDTPHSSHGRLLAWLRNQPPAQVLDVGCSDGSFGALLQSMGHEVTGVDMVKHEGVGARISAFVEADLNQGVPTEVGANYDWIVAGDVIEHTVDPGQVLRELGERLSPDGQLLVSIPNFAHWYPRTRVALGRFDYDRRGPLDQGHVRFFTRRSFERLLRRSGLRVVERDVVGSPVELVNLDSKSAQRALDGIGALDRAGTRVWPTMFGYQFLYKLERA